MPILDRFASFRAATAAALLDGPGAIPPDVRRAIASGAPPEDLADLVNRIRTNARSVTDRDIDALRERYTEDQLFEIIVSAAFGAAHDRLTAARHALEDA